MRQGKMRKACKSSKGREEEDGRRREELGTGNTTEDAEYMRYDSDR